MKQEINKKDKKLKGKTISNFNTHESRKIHLNNTNDKQGLTTESHTDNSNTSPCTWQLGCCVLSAALGPHSKCHVAAAMLNCCDWHVLPQPCIFYMEFAFDKDQWWWYTAVFNVSKRSHSCSNGLWPYDFEGRRIPNFHAHQPFQWCLFRNFSHLSSYHQCFQVWFFNRFHCDIFLVNKSTDACKDVLLCCVK